MSKHLKTISILFIILIISLNTYFSFATSDSYDDEANSSSDDYSYTNSSNNNVIEENSSKSSLQTLSPSSVTSVTSKENYSQANLELNNILCIILISIGILLILFAIAILIRIKR